jgi:hypothetical protein
MQRLGTIWAKIHFDDVDLGRHRRSIPDDHGEERRKPWRRCQTEPFNRSCLQLSSFHQSSKKTLRPGGYILRSCEPCASGRAADGGYEEERRVYLGKRQGKDGLDYDFV